MKNIVIGTLTVCLLGISTAALIFYNRVGSLRDMLNDEYRLREVCETTLADLQKSADIHGKNESVCSDDRHTQLGWWDIPAASPRSAPRDIDNGIRFDACREKATLYNDQPWFVAFIGLLKKYNLDEEFIGEGCLSADGTLLIFMDQENIYKFDTQKKELQRAVLDSGNKGLSFMTFLRFGKRVGGHIIVHSGYGDAGCAFEATSAYYFVDNIVKMVSARRGCVDPENESAGIQWETIYVE